MSNNSSVRTITWIGDTTGYVRLLDQTLLPTRLEYRDCHTVEEIWESIRFLARPGAPAIGIAAAMGVVLGVQKFTDSSKTAFARKLHEVAEYLRSSRPTAVNLFWAVDRVVKAANLNNVQAQTASLDCDQIKRILLKEALEIEKEDRPCAGRSAKCGAADREWPRSADSLQRRRPGHGRLRHGIGGHVRRCRTGQEISGFRR